MQCGTTENGCNGHTGMYRIEWTLPDAPYVRYRYAGEEWKEVKGGIRFTTENPPTEPGQNATNYHLVYQSAVILGGVLNSWSEDIVYRGQSIRGPISGRKIYAFYLDSGTTWQVNSGHWWFDDGGLAPIGYKTADIWWQNPWNRNRSRDYTVVIQSANGMIAVTPSVSLSGIKFVRFQRADGKPEEIAPKCIFKVFDFKNAVLFESTSSVCPEALVIPEAYGSNKGIARISNNDENKLLKVVNTEEVGAKVTNVLLGNTLIKKLISPLGASLYPRVCWDCDEDKKCPSDTCEVECLGHICCYDKKGNPVKSFTR